MTDISTARRHSDDPGWERLPDWAEAEPHNARREAQRQVNIEIGEGSDDVPLAELHTVDQMIERFVLITDGSQVAPIDRPQAVMALKDFSTKMAGSKEAVPTGKDGKQIRMVPAAKLWLEHPRRMEAEALTFRAGGKTITTEPDTGRAALNLWRPIDRPAAPADWQHRARLFTGHVEWLWRNDAHAFLDWLAHIEQQPGVLPHFGWVHVSREHGKGRNWISSVLTRVWRGYVAASLDLISVLNGGFNGRMSRKLLAIVDEINEGGNASYQHAQKLREIVTAEHRHINPKYGRTRDEWNACRWLMFSNHTGAIPLGEDDRRFWIASHDGQPKEPDYYSTLYGVLADPMFIASISEFLRRRDISGFKPGQRPPMTDAKTELIAFGQSEDDIGLRNIVSRWPVDLITASELTSLLQDNDLKRGATRHAMDRAGVRRLDEAKVRIYGQGPQRLYAVRNHAEWHAKKSDDRRAEVERRTDGDKREAFDGEQ